MYLLGSTFEYVTSILDNTIVCVCAFFTKKGNVKFNLKKIIRNYLQQYFVSPSEKERAGRGGAEKTTLEIMFIRWLEKNTDDI